jgi:hypothetical protein
MAPEGGATGVDSVAEALAACTEAGRLKRAVKLADQVDFLIAEGELIIAAVANYNVVIDVAARRIQHGCRDFQGQAPSRHLCKHVAATVLALDQQQSLSIAAELAEGAAAPGAGVVVPWRFEVITRFTPGR